MQTTSTTPTTTSTKNDSTLIAESGDQAFKSASLSRGQKKEPLNAEELLEFQRQLWSLLEKRARLYTSGESSSIPEATAHQLLLSVCFTLGIDPDNPDFFKVRTLLSEGLEAAFLHGLKEIEHAMEQSDKLWKAVGLSTPLLESHALKDTLESLRQFRNVYDYRYFAHEVPGDIDYPLCHAVPDDMLGVVYMNEYLERLLIENRFMRCFEREMCHRLLKTVSSEYRLLIINLFEPIAVNALGLTFIEKDARGLTISSSDRKTIATTLCESTEKDAILQFCDVSHTICDKLKLHDAKTRGYLEATARNLALRVMRLADEKALKGVFLSF